MVSAAPVLSLDELVGQVGRLVDGLEPERLCGSDARVAAERFARLERLAAAGRVVCAARVASTGAWDDGVHRDAAGWAAAASKSSKREAQRSLAAGSAASAMPEVGAALRAGAITAGAAADLGASDNPAAAAVLVDVAASDSPFALRQACREATSGRSAAAEAAAAEAIFASRHLRTWTDRDGAGMLQARLCPEDLAGLLASLEPFHQQLFDSARAAGARERVEAIDADALVAMARAAAAAPVDAGDPPRRPPRQVIVRVSHEALLRGYREAGETAEIDGVGQVPVATVRAAISDDAFLSAVEVDGVEIRRVVHLKRDPTRAMLTALYARDVECVVPGCHARFGLENDHVEEWSPTRVTRLDALARLCRWHHRQKTYRGAVLSGRPGAWEWTPPPGSDPGPDPFPDTRPPDTGQPPAGPPGAPPGPPSAPPTRSWRTPESGRVVPGPSSSTSQVTSWTS